MTSSCDSFFSSGSRECYPCTEVIFDYVKDETLIPPSYFTQLSNANAGTTSQYWSENLVRVTIAYLRIEQQVGKRNNITQ